MLWRVPAVLIAYTAQLPPASPRHHLFQLTCLTVVPQHSFGSRSPSFLPSRCWRVAPRAGSLPGSQPRNKRLSCTALHCSTRLRHSPNIPSSLCPSTSTSSTFTSTLSERLSRLCSTVCCHCPSSVSGLSSAQSALQWCRFLRYIISGFASRSFFLCPAPSIIRRRHPTAAALDRQIILESIPESHSKKPSNRTWQTRLEPDRVPAVNKQATNLEPSSPPYRPKYTSKHPARLPPAPLP